MSLVAMSSATATRPKGVIVEEGAQVAHIEDAAEVARAVDHRVDRPSVRFGDQLFAVIDAGVSGFKDAPAGRSGSNTALRRECRSLDR